MSGASSIDVSWNTQLGHRSEYMYVKDGVHRLDGSNKERITPFMGLSLIHI